MSGGNSHEKTIREEKGLSGFLPCAGQAGPDQSTRWFVANESGRHDRAWISQDGRDDAGWIQTVTMIWVGGIIGVILAGLWGWLSDWLVWDSGWFETTERKQMMIRYEQEQWHGLR